MHFARLKCWFLPMMPHPFLLGWFYGSGATASTPIDDYFGSNSAACLPISYWPTFRDSQILTDSFSFLCFSFFATSRWSKHVTNFVPKTEGPNRPLTIIDWLVPESILCWCYDSSCYYGAPASAPSLFVTSCAASSPSNEGPNFGTD